MKSQFATMRALTWILICSVGFVSGGATCARREPVMALPPPPPVLGATPALVDVVAAVNRTSAIRELSSNSATVDVLSMPALPKLSATLALRKEREFRLRASLPIVMGSGLDMGSNDALFWFEVPEGMGRTLYFAHHEQYRQQLQRAILPVDPTWVMGSLGLTQLDAANVVQGPVMRPDGKLELRSTVPMPSGTYQQVCYVDAQKGHVTDQFLYSPSGATIAESHAWNHQYYVDQQCSLPHNVKLILNPASGPPLELQIDVGTYAVNQILSGDPNLFVIPQGANNVVDLTTIGPVSGTIVTPASYRSAGSQSENLGPMPYRGLVEPPSP
ncbi:hypothetical protein NHH03_00680 [Stieleria sp. TO1_6]|uniref:hypothetical protein n=1 Tax=Stieleria tagensis TaxID=2956795 RepID=UPI00209AD90B|nr:hypothetical protein [Stieleria tagensis]MCO8120231.1 hypothetical protein [Stieleria tagensis]